MYELQIGELPGIGVMLISIGWRLRIIEGYNFGFEHSTIRKEEDGSAFS